MASLTHRATSRLHLARTAAHDHQEARARYEEALPLYRRFPEPYSIGWTLVRLARLCAGTHQRVAYVHQARDD